MSRRSLYYDGSGTLLQTVNEQWRDQFLQTQQQTVLPNGITTEIDKQLGGFPGVPGEEDDYTAGATPSLARKILYQYYEYGFPNQIITEDGSGNKVAETDIYYDGQTSLGAASTAVPVASGVSNLPANTHDETNYGLSSTLPRANATKVVQWENNGASPATNYTYDETGQALSMQDPNGNTTTYSYADNYSGGNPSSNTNAYLTKITRPAVNVAHMETFSYRFGDGQLASMTDENGQVTGYVYNDPLSRLTETDYPDGGKTTLSYNDAAPSPSVTTAQLINSSGTQKTTTAIRDGVGHVVHTQLTSDPSGTDTVDMVYDGHGNMVSATNPYRSGNTTYTTTSTYDALQRKVGETEPDSTTRSWCYNSIPSAPSGSGVPKQYCSSGNLSSKTGTWMDMTDESGNSRQQVSDGLGRLIAVMEPDPASGTDTLETDYKYDALDNLTQVDQWGGAVNSPGDRQRTFVYDSLSRLSSSTNPEAGTIGYTYDSNGNVHTRTDPRGVVTTYSYDGLNRLGGKTYTNDPSGTPAPSYTYDIPIQGWNFIDQSSPMWTGVKQLNLIGRLSYENNSSSTIVYGYDQLGRTTLKSACTPSTCGSDHYDMHASYDLAGDMMFADRGLDAARNAATPGTGYYYGGLAFSYNPAAQMQSAQSDIVDAAHPQSILANMMYWPSGQIYNAELGAQYGQASTYDTRLRLEDRGSINLNGDTVLADHWDYYPNGTMEDQNDSAQGEFQYQYDHLNRVTNAAIPPFTEAYGYDNWGNQTSHTVTEGSSYQWQFMPTTLNQSSGPGVLYDAAGNMTADGQHRYSYDAENRVAVVLDQGVLYDYDPEGNRVATVTGATVSGNTASGGTVAAEYLYDTGGALVTTVNNGGMLVRAILRAQGQHWGDYIGAAGSGGVRTEFRLVNAVGTLVANGDTNGNFIEGCLSGPFGDGEDCTPSYDFTETHFADKLRDAETYNDYFGARYFNSIMGRFMSPDDFGGHLENPQTLNKYAYAGNNPLTNTDPSGHDFYQSCDNASSTCGNQNVGTKDNPVNHLVLGTTGSNGQFTAGVVTSASLSDPNSGNSAVVNGTGVQVTSAAGTAQGIFINGTPSADIQGQGAGFDQFSFHIDSNYAQRGVLAAGTATYLGSGGRQGMVDTINSIRVNGHGPFRYAEESTPFGNPFHPGSDNFRFSTGSDPEDNNYGPSPHFAVPRAGGGSSDFHVDSKTGPIHLPCALVGIGCY